MKRTYLVTVRVVVDGDTALDFARAEADLLREPPWKKSTCVGVHGADYRTGYAVGGEDYGYSVETLTTGAKVRRERKRK